MSKEINVLITGRSGTGKTAIGLFLQEKLEELGINVKFADPDGNPNIVGMEHKLESLIYNGLEVTIEEMHTAYRQGRHIESLTPID